MILLVDNYDSFSYNLYQLVGSVNPDIKVIRNDEKSVQEIAWMSPEHIILSPGPGKPSDAGICEEIVRELGGKIPILGVCLGHQAICEVFGATVSYAGKLMHGKMSSVKLDRNCPIFYGMEECEQVARYHSLIALRDSIPEELAVTAVTDSAEVMAVRHKTYDVYGVQFHPESILTPNGMTMLKNFLQIKKI